MARNVTRTTKKNFVAKSLNLVYFLQDVAATCEKQKHRSATRSAGMFPKSFPAFYDCFIPC